MLGVLLDLAVLAGVLLAAGAVVGLLYAAVCLGALSGWDALENRSSTAARVGAAMSGTLRRVNWGVVAVLLVLALIVYGQLFT